MHEESSSHKGEAISRRLFAQRVFTSVAISVVPSSAAEAESPINELTSKPADLTVEDWDEVQARYKNLLRVYGQRLSTSEQDHILHVLTTNQYMLKSIRTFVVQNGDPSACTLRVVK